MASKNKNFQRDFEELNQSFPKLSYTWNAKNKLWIVVGDLDICDVKGDYWNTFDIAIFVSESYPYCVPQVFERSKIIPRNIDWHISNEGACCLDYDNKLLAQSRRGIRIKPFIVDEVYTYFANQLYKLEAKTYAGEEYGHFTDGLIQYYTEDLKFPTAQAAMMTLSKILNNTDLTRNVLCPCNSGKKIKRCHGEAIKTIKSIGRDKISKDFMNLQKHITEIKNKPR